MLFIAFLSNISRVVRWQIMINTLNYKPAFINTFLAMMLGYFANLLLPRMGELSRCAVLAKYEKLSFTRLLGTVVAERLMDIFILILSLILVLVLEFRFISSILLKVLNLNEGNSIINITFIIGGFLFLLFLLWCFKGKIKRTRFYLFVLNFLLKFKEGLLSLKKVIINPWFLIHSVLIFFFYFLMMYFSFFAFPYTEHLSIIAGLTLFVAGSLGMIAPVQGGIGPWHFMIITTMIAYGVAGNEASVFALVVHGALNLMILLLGLLSTLLLPLINRNRS